MPTPTPVTTLSVVIPCYNETATIRTTVGAVVALASTLRDEGMALEIVAVDDASTDQTLATLHDLAVVHAPLLRVVAHATNQGKGGAIQTARAHVTGDIVVIQDADLEYDPVDIPTLIHPILQGHADAVLGTRFGGGGAHRVLYFWHRVGNGVLTLLSNAMTNLNVTDMETGYKAFTRAAFSEMHLTNRRFGIEPEIVARLSQMGARVYEVPISYHGRTYAEGKKITWRDGVAALRHILHARLTAHAQPPLRAPGSQPRVMELVPAAAPTLVTAPADPASH